MIIQHIDNQFEIDAEDAKGNVLTLNGVAEYEIVTDYDHDDLHEFVARCELVKVDLNQLTLSRHQIEDAFGADRLEKIENYVSEVIQDRLNAGDYSEVA